MEYYTATKRNEILVHANIWMNLTGIKLSEKNQKKLYDFIYMTFSLVQSLIRVWFFVTPWTAACQTSLSITSSWCLFRLTSIESVMQSNHLILCHPLLLLPSVFPASGSFPVSQFITSGGQSIGASASVSVLPVNIQSWFPGEGNGNPLQYPFPENPMDRGAW